MTIQTIYGLVTPWARTETGALIVAWKPTKDATPPPNWKGGPSCNFILSEKDVTANVQPS